MVEYFDHILKNLDKSLLYMFKIKFGNACKIEINRRRGEGGRSEKQKIGRESSRDKETEKKERQREEERKEREK